MILIYESLADSKYKLHNIIRGIEGLHEKAIAELGNLLKPKIIWSEKAMLNHWPNVTDLTSTKDEISYWLGKAMSGVPLANDNSNFPLPDPLTIETAKKYIAEIYDMEISDIDNLQRM